MINILASQSYLRGEIIRKQGVGVASKFFVGQMAAGELLVKSGAFGRCVSAFFQR